MILIHPSSISKIMPDAKDKKEVLSVGAKTYLKSIAKQLMYGFYEDVDVKYVRKGNACENDSIALLNTVYFANYKKHIGRVDSDLMSGECDILHDDHVRDIKTAWSLATFPCIKEDAHDKDYEYQLRAYMHLYDRPKAYLDFCMVSTPEEFRKYEQASLHEVDHIDPRLRVTTICYERDFDIERKMLEKCRAAQEYVESIKALILSEREI
jgi:hypothetical protein